MLDLGDFVTPTTTGLTNVGVGNMAVSVDCPGGPTFDGVDYMHQSSCGPGADGNLVSSLRNLNGVVSTKSDGSGVDWLISSDPSLSTTYRTYGDLSCWFYCLPVTTRHHPVGNRSI